jgi:hypothetical protein
LHIFELVNYSLHSFSFRAYLAAPWEVFPAFLSLEPFGCSGLSLTPLAWLKTGRKGAVLISYHHHPLAVGEPHGPRCAHHSEGSRTLPPGSSSGPHAAGEPKLWQQATCTVT